MTSEFIKTKAAITVADLDRLELETGIKLPDDLRTHYLRYNGGRPQRPCFELSDGTLHCVHFFYSVGDKPSLSGAIKNIRGEEWFPQWLLPFASTEGGDDFCISTREEDFGSIWMFEHEFFDDEERALTFLAVSLEAFFNRLT